MSYEDRHITPFNAGRDMAAIYGEPVQLILKNQFIPDGVTIVGTRESVELFMDAVCLPDEFGIYGAGFYGWSRP